MDVLLARSVILWLMMDVQTLLPTISYFNNIVWYCIAIRIALYNKNIEGLYVTSRNVLGDYHMEITIIDT